MIIGFTGTRVPLPVVQKRALWMVLTHLTHEGATALRHGDCVGADKAAHLFAKALRLRVIIHPPMKRGYRAFCDDADEVLPELGYWARNREIVEGCDVLVACPKEGTTAADWQRSGTWYTANYAHDHDKPVWVVNHAGIAGTQVQR